MARKREEMIQEGASELLLSVFFDSPSVIRRQQAYSGAQGQYIRWCELEHLDPFTPNTLTLLNFLSYGSISLKWQATTVSTYKSAILNLFTDAKPITSDPRFKEFMDIIRSGTTKRLTNLSLDLTPILQHFQKLGGNDSMHIRDLTHKVCWLLGITGFMRPDDICCTDASLSKIENGRLILMVIFPKEKRNGQRIEKPIIISPHPDALLCPVKAYLSYRKRTGKDDKNLSKEAQQHPKDKQRLIKPLIRSIHNKLKPVKNDSISNHMQQIMQLIQTPETGPLKCRAVSATMAIVNKVPIDDVMIHGNWSSTAIVDKFYRLSRSTANNFSTAVLRMASTL
jgi:hypothetical protein